MGSRRYQSSRDKCTGNRPGRNPTGRNPLHGSLQRLGRRRSSPASQNLKKDEAGQTFVEYALVLAVIVVGVLLAATWGGLTTAIQGAIDSVEGSFTP